MTLERAFSMETKGGNPISQADGCKTTDTGHRAGKRGPTTAYCAAIAFIKAIFPADQWLCTKRAAQAYFQYIFRAWPRSRKSLLW